MFFLLGIFFNKFRTAINGKIKIAIIDDQPEYFPIEALRQLGYEVRNYKEFSLQDATELLQFDIALIDMEGVIKEDTKTGGGLLIKSLSKEVEQPIIVAISNHKFSAEAGTLMSLADARWDKNFESNTAWIQALEELINNHLNRSHLIDKIYELTEKNTKKFIKSIEKKTFIYFNDKNITNVHRELSEVLTNKISFEITKNIHRLSRFKI